MAEEANRRDFLRVLGVTVGAVAASAAGGGATPNPAEAQEPARGSIPNKPIKIGHMTFFTGPGAVLGEPSYKGTSWLLKRSTRRAGSSARGRSKPSKRTKRLALMPMSKKCAAGLPYEEVVRHVQQHPEQSTMRNSYQQAMNVRDVFAIAGKVPTGAVLLVDDLADSRWTLTVLGELLRRQGSGMVYPFALATMNASASTGA